MNRRHLLCSMTSSGAEDREKHASTVTFHDNGHNFCMLGGTSECFIVSLRERFAVFECAAQSKRVLKRQYDRAELRKGPAPVSSV